MPDGWEDENMTNPLFNDAGDDLDKDGYTNLKEYLGGSDPNDPTSTPEAERYDFNSD